MPRTFRNFWANVSKVSWFVSGEQINHLPKLKAEANNWPAIIGSIFPCPKKDKTDRPSSGIEQKSIADSAILYTVARHKDKWGTGF